VDPGWEQLCGADFGSVGGAQVRERKVCSDMHRLESQLFGLIVSHAALSRRASLAETMQAIAHAHRAHLQYRDEEFSDLVAAKARRLGTLMSSERRSELGRSDAQVLRPMPAGAVASYRP
jgi:hypothetical protein